MKFVLIFIIMAIILTGCSTQRGFPPEHGIVNLDKVSDTLYRGAQPNERGMEYLNSIGIKTVINLRQPNDSWPGEPKAAEALGMTYTNIPLNSLSAPTKAQIALILKSLDTLPKPAFVHCQFGCDRTGTVIACWRISQQQWNNADALADAEFHGMAAMEIGMKHFILNFKK